MRRRSEYANLQQTLPTTDGKLSISGLTPMMETSTDPWGLAPQALEPEPVSIDGVQADICNNVPESVPVVDPPPPMQRRGFTGTCCKECGYAMKWQPDGGTLCVKGHAFGPDGLAVEGVTSVAAEVPTQAQPTVPGAPVALESTGEPASSSAPIPDEGPAQPVPKARKARAPRMGDRSPIKAPPASPQPEPTHGIDEQYRRQQREAVARRLDELVLGEGYERIVEHVFTIDPWATYERLQKRLQLPVPAHAQTRVVLFDELDAAETLAKEAHQLFISAKETVRRFDADAVVMSVDMRQQATATLQQEKDSGQRSKQITDADVESRIASIFADEWRQLELRRSKARLMVDHMQRLSDAWKERARDLRSMFDGK